MLYELSNSIFSKVKCNFAIFYFCLTLTHRYSLTLFICHELRTALYILCYCVYTWFFNLKWNHMIRIRVYPEIKVVLQDMKLIQEFYIKFFILGM